MSGSRNERVTIKITLEIVGNGVIPLTTTKADPTFDEAEDHYCTRRAKEASEQDSQLKWDRLRRIAAWAGIWSSGVLLLLVVLALASTITVSPLAAMIAAGILTTGLRAIVQMVARVVGLPKIR